MSWRASSHTRPPCTTPCARADVIIDLGAHLGYFAVLGARANLAVRVIMVEVSPQNSAVLWGNVG